MQVLQEDLFLAGQSDGRWIIESPDLPEDLAATKREIRGWTLELSSGVDLTEQSLLVQRLYIGMQMLQESVDIDPDKRHGIPVLKGTRFKAGQVLAQLADGDSVESLARELRLNQQTIVDFLHSLAILINQPMLK